MEYEQVKRKVLEEQKEINSRNHSDLVDRIGVYLGLALALIAGFAGLTVLAFLFLIVAMLYGLDFTLEKRFRTLDGKLNILLQGKSYARN